MFYILSQNGERLYNMNGHIEVIGYERKRQTKKIKKDLHIEDEEQTRHTIQVYDGCSEEAAEYRTKEECLAVMQLVAENLERSKDGNVVIHLPKQEELEKILKEHKKENEIYKQLERKIEDMTRDFFGKQ